VTTPARRGVAAAEIACCCPIQHSLNPTPHPTGCLGLRCPDRLEDLHEQLEHHAGRGHRPDEDQQTRAPGTADRDDRKRCVGAGDHHEDRGVIEPTPERLARTITCEVVEGRAAQHGKQPGAVDRKAEENGSILIAPYHDRQNGTGSEAKNHAHQMDHRVGAPLGPALQPWTRRGGARYDAVSGVITTCGRPGGRPADGGVPVSGEAWAYARRSVPSTF
jgi:hypothetical protein